MSEPNKTLTIGTRLLLTEPNGGIAPVGVWLTVVGSGIWDGTEWWQLEADNTGETYWLRMDSEVFSTATYYGG